MAYRGEGRSGSAAAGKDRGAAGKKLNQQALAGAVRALPIVLGYLPIGVAYGVLASTAGLSVYSAAAMSVFVFAGSAQLIAVGLIAAGAGVMAITVTTFLVNLRHLLMSASLAPYLGRLSSFKQALFCFELTDETFAVHSAFFRRYGVPPSGELFAVNLSAQLAWVAGSVLGAWIGGRLVLDTEAIGIDYALPAMFIALLVMQVENRRHAAIALLSAALGLSFYLVGMNQLYIILATVIAATAGACLKENPAGVEEKEGGDPA